MTVDVQVLRIERTTVNYKVNYPAAELRGILIRLYKVTNCDQVGEAEWLYNVGESDKEGGNYDSAGTGGVSLKDWAASSGAVGLM